MPFSHSRRPPYCIQFSMHGLMPPNQPMRGGFQQFAGASHAANLDWPADAKDAFRNLLREDVPLTVTLLIGRLNA